MFNVLPTGWSHSGGAPTPWLMAGAAVHAKQQKAPLTLPLLRIDPFAYKALPAVFALKATQGQEQLFPWVEEPCGTFLFFFFFLHNHWKSMYTAWSNGFWHSLRQRWARGNAVGISMTLSILWVLLKWEAQFHWQNILFFLTLLVNKWPHYGYFHLY